VNRRTSGRTRSWLWLILNLFYVDIPSKETCTSCEGRHFAQSHHGASSLAPGRAGPADGWWQSVVEGHECSDAEDTGKSNITPIHFENHLIMVADLGVFMKLKFFKRIWWLYLVEILIYPSTQIRCCSQENADRTSAFIVLIYLLRPVGSSKFAGRQQGTTVVRNQKFLDLVVKCLIKLTKVSKYACFRRWRLTRFKLYNWIWGSWIWLVYMVAGSWFHFAWSRSWPHSSKYTWILWGTRNGRNKEKVRDGFPISYTSDCSVLFCFFYVWPP
jgi:hypothetical protein